MVSTFFPREPVARALTVATMAMSLSTGLFYAVSALYFTRTLGLSATTVGLGLTVAGGCGVVASYAAGWGSDRVPADLIQRWAMVGQGLALLAYVLADGAAWFVVVACFAVALRGAGGSSRQALIARWFTGPDRVTTRAGLRVVTNVGIGLGTVVAAATLVIDTAVAYRVTMAAAGVLVLLATMPLFGLDRRVPELTYRLRPMPRGGAGEQRGRSPLTDRTYLGAVAMAAVLAMNFGLQTVGIPLWVAGHTEAPTVVISLLMVINTVFVAVFQVPASRGTHDIAVAGRAVRRAGVLLAVGCGLLAAAAYGGVGPAVVLLVLGSLALAAGEVFSEAGNWGLAFELADPRSAGAYQGVSQTGYAVAAMLAPAVVTVTAISHGTPGWILLGVAFLAAGVTTAVIARRAAARTPSPCSSSPLGVA
ncbi:MAG TPA: MFS transporter [Actinophytocola sp.]|nr:MFS transporter [Actinophytocola sp.]